MAAGTCAADPLPDPDSLHLSRDTAALAELRSARQARASAGGPSSGASGGASASGGLWLCSGEWSGLSLHHAGTWQLSLVYGPPELASFSGMWRFLASLRWARRRVDAARHAACAPRRGGGSGSGGLAARDADEAAAVVDAAAARLGMSRARPAAPDGWLSSRSELLLLQEVGQLLAAWQQFALERLMCSAWGDLEAVRATTTTTITTTCRREDEAACLCMTVADSTSRCSTAQPSVGSPPLPCLPHSPYQCVCVCMHASVLCANMLPSPPPPSPLLHAQHTP